MQSAVEDNAFSDTIGLAGLTSIVDFRMQPSMSLS